MVPLRRGTLGEQKWGVTVPPSFDSAAPEHQDHFPSWWSSHTNTGLVYFVVLTHSVLGSVEGTVGVRQGVATGIQ